MTREQVAEMIGAALAEALADAIAAERARCAAVCREVARHAGTRGGAAVARECAEAIERGPVDGWVLELAVSDGWAPASQFKMRDRYATSAEAWDAARAAFPDTEYLSLMCRVVERGTVAS